MKRLHPHLLIILFVFSQLNPMDRQESIFSFQDIRNFLDKMALFFPKKKDFDKDFDIVIPDELSPFEVDNLLPKEASIYIAHFLQRLNPNPAFLLSRMVYHTQSPLVVRHENKY